MTLVVSIFTSICLALLVTIFYLNSEVEKYKMLNDALFKENQNFALSVKNQNEALEKIKIETDSYKQDREKKFLEIENKYNNLLKKNRNQAKPIEPLTNCECEVLKKSVELIDEVLKESFFEK